MIAAGRQRFTAKGETVAVEMLEPAIGSALLGAQSEKRLLDLLP